MTLWVVNDAGAARPVELVQMSVLAPSWVFGLVPKAGEGGGCWRGGSRREVPYVRPGMGADPVAARAEAGRRARSRVRRYCAANRLNRLGTLTYAGAGCFDPVELRHDLAAFFKALRAELGGDPLPYLWVPEWHPGGHGLHAHYAMGRYVPRNVIASAWGHGYFNIKQLNGLRVGSGAWEQARVAAGYLAKYVSKSFEQDAAGQERPPGLHRFDVAQGFTPQTLRLRGKSAGDVIRQACQIMGAGPLRSWSSAEKPDWAGSPAIWAQWA